MLTPEDTFRAAIQEALDVLDDESLSLWERVDSSYQILEAALEEA